ncbi:MAG: protein kinase [Candidatus Obscuribacterales bacterium]
MSPVASADLNTGSNSDPVCANCGKSRPTSRRAGSFTAFLFKELRCNCAGAASKPVAKRGVRSNGSRSSSGSSSGSGSGSSSGLATSAGGRTRSRSRTAARVAQRRQFTESFRNSKVRPNSAGEIKSSEANAEAAFQSGSLIGGAFRLESVIGQGGMGVVYLAEQLSLKKRVALKILSPELVNEQSWLRFKAEAKTLAALNHSSLVKVYDLGIHESTIPYYSMDFLQGQSLEEILARDGPLPLKQALAIFIEVLDGLAYAHRNGIVHRDLKPGNIMLCTVDGARSVKILDFGISKLIGPHAASSQSLTAVGEIFGSPFYMSPEQCTGAVVDARSDIYSVGCTLVEVLTGFVPFEGEEFIETVMMHQEEPPPLLADLEPGLKYPVALDRVLAKCLAKRPQDRYQSAKEMALDLGRVLEGKEVMAPELASLPQNSSFREAKTGDKVFQLPLLPALFAGGLAIVVVAASAYFILRPTTALDYSPRLRSAASADAVVDSTAALQSKDAAVSALGVAPSGSDFTVFRKAATASRNGDTALKTKLAPVIVDPYDASEMPKGSEKETYKSKVSDVDDSARNDFAVMVDMSSKRLDVMGGVQKPPSGSQNETFKYSSLVMVKGVKIRRFNFPNDISIGHFSAAREESTLDAKGTVDLITGVEYAFIPNRLIEQYPQYLKRFRLGDVRIVSLWPYLCRDKLLDAVSYIPGVQKLTISKDDGFTVASFSRSLSRLKSLREFEARAIAIGGSALAAANCWSQLEKLKLSEVHDLGSLLEKLQSSSKLAELTIRKSRLSHRDIELIARLHQLVALDLGDNKLSMDDLRLLAKLSRLKFLAIRNCQLDTKALQELQNFKHLVVLDVFSTGTPQRVRAGLIKELPRVRVQ